jgi:hypothetical protein
MFKTLLQKNNKEAQKSTSSNFLLIKSSQYLQTLQVKLGNLIGSRLDTFFSVFIVILMFKNSKIGLLLSELWSCLGRDKAGK